MPQIATSMVDPTGTALVDDWVRSLKTYVLHTASPYLLNVQDPQKDLVEPAVQGTRTVLKIRSHLGIEFRPIKVTIRDTMADLARWGHIPVSLTQGDGASS